MKAKRAWIILDDSGTRIVFSKPLYEIGIYQVVPIVYFEIDED